MKMHNYGLHYNETQILRGSDERSWSAQLWNSNFMHDYGLHESETQILRDSNAWLWSAQKWNSNFKRF